MHPNSETAILSLSATYCSRFLNPHAPSHLHAGDQISGGPHSAHARSVCVSKRHGEGIADANLQPVQPTDFYHGFRGPGDDIYGGMVGYRNGADTHAHIGVNRDFGDFADRLGERHHPGDIPGGGLGGIGIDHRAIDRRTGLFNKLDLIVGVEAGQPGAFKFQTGMHAQNKFTGHTDLNAGVRVFFPESAGWPAAPPENRHRRPRPSSRC